MTGRQLGVDHRRVEVPDCAEVVELVWAVSWRLEVPLVQQVVAHPTFHLVFEGGEVEVHGPRTALFEKTTAGQGEAIGIKLWPGLARRLVRAPEAWLDRRASLEGAMHDAAQALSESLAALPSFEARIASVVAWSGEHLGGRPDEDERLARDATRLVADKAQIVTAAALAFEVGVSLRKLQRVFRAHVGLSPKRVLRTYRIHEALDWLARGESLADLAAALEYSDQAHFSRDFRRLIGQTPHAYQREMSAALASDTKPR